MSRDGRRPGDEYSGEPPWPAAEPVADGEWPAGGQTGSRPWPAMQDGSPAERGPRYQDDPYGQPAVPSRGGRRGRHSGPPAPAAPYPAQPDRYGSQPGRSGPQQGGYEAPPGGYPPGQERPRSRPGGYEAPPRSQPDRYPGAPAPRSQPDRYPGPPGPQPDRYQAQQDSYGGPSAGRSGQRGRPAPAFDPYASGQDAFAGDPARSRAAERYPAGPERGGRGGYPADDRYAEPRDWYAGPGHEDDQVPPAGDRGGESADFFLGLNDARPPGGRGPSRGRAGRSGRNEPAGTGEPVDPDDHGGGRSTRRRRRGRMAVLIAVLVIVIPLLVAGIYGYRVIAGHYFPANYSGAGTGQVVVQIYPGDSATVVGQRLFDLGVVASARAFVLAAESSTNASGLQPGFYRMHKQMNATLAFNLLLRPSSRVQLTVTIPEGLRVSQIIAALGKNSGIKSADYQRALRNAAALGLPSYARGNPEGYLFPATYTIQPGMNATGVLQAMVKRFDQEAASLSLQQAAARVNLTPAEVIVVASLAQAEGGKLSDFPKIARVIYNRLAASMPLQLDSTVLYALHSYGIIATNQQLQTPSRYNTYKYNGLPPGPIDSPGDAAIRAALHPAAGNWLYFVTVNPKTKLTKFTASAAQFAQFTAELQRNLAQGG